MGLLGPQGWLQKNGTSKLPVETLHCQPTLQGQWADINDQLYCFNLIWTWLILSLFLLCHFPKVSDTYPADLFVPESATPPVIVGSSKFRSRGRFPTLSYYSKENHVSWHKHIIFSLCFPSVPMITLKEQITESLTRWDIKLKSEWNKSVSEIHWDSVRKWKENLQHVRLRLLAVQAKQAQEGPMRRCPVCHEIKAWFIPIF